MSTELTVVEGNPVELTVVEGTPVVLEIQVVSGPQGPQGPAGTGLSDGDKGDVLVASSGASWTVEGIQGRAIASTAPTNAQALVWNSTSSQWEPQTQSGGGGISDGDKGDITVSSSGATWTIDNGVVTFAKMQDVASDRLIGRDATGTGSLTTIQVLGGIEFSGTDRLQTSAFTGDVTKTTGGTTLTIANDAVTTSKIVNDAVTFAKMQNVAAARVLGRETGVGSGDVKEVVLDSMFVWGTSGSDPMISLASLGTANLDDNSVTYAKIQNVSATDRILGRQTAGAGDVEEITCTSAGRAILDDADAAAQRTTLGLGTAATSNTGDFAAASHTHAAADVTSGQLAVARGGTGLDSSAASNGQLLIGNGSGFSLAALTAGSNVTITNGSGSVTVAGVKTTTTEFTYTSSSTYTVPSGLDYIVVEGCGGGGGGGSGSTTVGGNGGCGGTWFNAVIPAALITTSTLTVTIGTGGGAGVIGGDSELQLASGGAKLVIWPGGRAATTDVRNITGGVTISGFAAGGSASGVTAGRHGGMGPGGGGAGQNSTTGAGTAGGAAASMSFTAGSATAGGGAAGGANGGGNGTTATVTLRGFGEGAGGGGANNAGAGGNGGDGTRGSGGGGGGRGSTTGGTGGTGGNGFIRIIEVKTT